ncbi:MAG TPA: hypothetical protein VGF87_08975 [Acidimicrobiales bacterium]|jgi:hypothetical protein
MATRITRSQAEVDAIREALKQNPSTTWTPADTTSVAPDNADDADDGDDTEQKDAAGHGSTGFGRLVSHPLRTFFSSK